MFALLSDNFYFMKLFLVAIFFVQQKWLDATAEFSMFNKPRFFFFGELVLLLVNT